MLRNQYLFVRFSYSISIPLKLSIKLFYKNFSSCCTTRNVVYQACISPMEQQRDGERIYIGISAGNWKQRWYSHRHSFSNPKLRYQTALLKYFWGLKDQGLSPQIKWKILRHSSAANSFNGRCNLCLDEKISIINFKNRKLLLNKRNELVFKCRHRGKFKLS